MTVLVGCEESQTLTKAFRARGHNAFSCDLVDCSGGHPEWHLKMDIIKAIDSRKWDLIILHPPCTKVAVSGNGTYAGTPDRINAAQQNAGMYFYAVRHCDKVAMEQPVTVLRSIRPDLPKPQYVDLWWFGEKEMKKTAWFLHGLPKLKATNNVGPPPTDMEERRKWMKTWMMTPSDDRGVLRSKLNPKMAGAIAEQWG
jgi:hypothetical protein